MPHSHAATSPSPPVSAVWFVRVGSFFMRHATVVVLAVSAATALAGCRGNKPVAAPPPPPRMTVIRPAPVLVRDYWNYNGYLETTKSVEVRSKIRGYLKKVDFAEGTEVNRKTSCCTRSTMSSSRLHTARPMPRTRRPRPTC